MHVGADGFATLGLACIVAVATCGLIPAWSTWRVMRTARRTSKTVPGGDVIVVFGGGLVQGDPSPDFRHRLERAVSESRGGRIVVLGGATRPGSVAEADVGRNWLIAHGIDHDRISSETESRDTLENLRALREKFVEHANELMVLITSRYHLERTSTMASGLGIAHVLCAADEKVRPTLPYLWRLIHEGFLVHWYVVGKTWATLTGNQRMLDRIS